MPVLGRKPVTTVDELFGLATWYAESTGRCRPEGAGRFQGEAMKRNHLVLFQDQGSPLMVEINRKRHLR
jgi:hypothetical protein